MRKINLEWRKEWLNAVILAALTTFTPTEAAASAELELSWYSFGNGAAATVVGEAWRLRVSIGRYETSSASGGSFNLRGGFFSRVPESPIFADSFESGDTSAWDQTQGRVENENTDLKPEISNVEQQGND